jgi:transposase
MSFHSQPPVPVITETASPPFAAFIGIDWADEEHAVCVLEGERIRHETLTHTPEAILDWATRVEREFSGQPVAVMVEQSHGGLAHALMQFPHLVLFPINPKQAARYREALANSGKKDDPADGESLARFVREHHGSLRAWRPNDEITRQLSRLVELRRKTVEMRMQTVQQLRSVLKLYFPLALDVAGELSQPLARELLRRWPTLRDLQRANPTTLRKFFLHHGHRNEEKVEALIERIRAAKPLTTDPAILAPNAMFVAVLLKQLVPLDQALDQFDSEIAKLFAAHPDADIFRSPPGAGAALAPRLLVAFGSDRDRFASAAEVQAYSGIAPITKRSGKSHHVQRRYACNKFLRQTFHEFADHARKWSRWSTAFYDYLRAKGYHHHAALRSLGFKWIRILFRCWKDHKPYNEDLYVQQLKAKGVPYFANIQPT